MTAEPFYFGHRSRRLYGMLHRPGDGTRGVALLCPPLLQDGFRIHRALWTLAWALAASGLAVLRFDWYGSGDSGGGTHEMDFAGLIADIAMARERIEAEALTRPDGVGGAGPVMFAARSAAIPLLTYLSSQQHPVELVLLAPQLDGAALVRDWNDQHRTQLLASGRYPFGGAAPSPGEMLGFRVSNALLEPLAAQDAGRLALAAGSRVLLAAWGDEAASTERFIDVQREAGIAVEVLPLEPGEAPAWTDPQAFETQVFPRRSIAALAARIAAWRAA